MRRLLLTLLAAPLLCAATVELPLPAVPSELRTPHERAAYVAEHFYDSLSPADARSRAHAEQNFANFASVLPFVDSAALRSAAASALHRYDADADIRAMFADVVQHYLFDLHSPVRNHAAYEVFLELELSRGGMSETDSTRAAWMLEMMRLCKPGTPAPDFEYTGRDGRAHRLSDHFGRRFLLMFYDPDCTDCADAIVRLRTVDMPVVAVCSSSDSDRWAASAKIPSEWTDALAPTSLADTDLYFIPRLPTFYIIASDGTIESKDADM